MKKVLVVCGNGIASSSIIVSSTKIDNPDITTKVIVGAGLLTGIGEEAIFDAVKKELTK